MTVESAKPVEEIKEGDHVAWNWGAGRVEGDVKEISDSKMTKTSKGKQITKVGTEDNPALFIERKGNPVVKKLSEVAALDPEEDIPKSEKVMTRAQAAKQKEGGK